MARSSVPIFPVKGNLTQLWGYYKIVRLAKYVQFKDIEKWGTYGTPFTLIGARSKPGLPLSYFFLSLNTFTARTVRYWWRKRECNSVLQADRKNIREGETKGRCGPGLGNQGDTLQRC
jgi:hypothetical protein